MTTKPNNLRVKSTFKEIAAIWLPGSPETAVGGFLSSERGKLSFTTSPIYTTLTLEQTREALLAFGKKIVVEVIPIFHGRTADRKFSLLWSQVLDHPGLLDAEDGISLSSSRYRSSLMVSGLHLIAADNEQIERAYFTFSTIHTFYSIEMTMTRGENIVSFSYDPGGQSIFAFSSLALQTEIKFEVVPQTKLSHSKGLRVLSRPRVRVKPRKAKSIKWYSQLQRRLENFFSLLLGTSVSSKDVSLYADNVEGHLIYDALQKQEKPRRQSCVFSTSSILGSALANWLAVSEEDQAVERTFLVVLRKSRLFAETEFLSLAQAAEGFGRLKHGDVNFAEKLRLLFEMISLDLVQALWGDPGVFIRKIVDTRNYYTHPLIKRGREVVTDPNQLFLTNRRLAGFLRCVMLLDIGLPESSLRDAITDDCQRWS